jgi:hypothetical protein
MIADANWLTASGRTKDWRQEGKPHASATWPRMGFTRGSRLGEDPSWIEVIEVLRNI